MVTPKSVVETTPLVVARIEQLERAKRFGSFALVPSQHRDPRRPTRLAPGP